MGYLSDVLNKTDKEQQLMFVGTGIILINNDNKILIARRRDNGEWSLPGGSLEIGETLEECIIRETYEETGLQLNESELHFNLVTTLKNPVIKNNREIHVISVSYFVHGIISESIQIDNREFGEYRWLTISEIYTLDNITEYSKVALDKYKSQIS